MRNKYTFLTVLSLAAVGAAAIGLSACVDNAHTHTMEAVAGVGATCTTAGTQAHYKCTDCGKLFSDEAGKTEINESSTVVAALGHDMTKHDALSETCVAAGTVEHYTCSREEGVYYADEAGTQTLEGISVAATGHDMTKHEAVDATCTEAGSVEYYSCSHEDGVYYADEAGTQKLDEVTVAATGHKRITSVPQKDATCAEAGYEGYYRCADCGSMFTDEDGKNVIENPVTIPKLPEHGEAVFKYDGIPTPEEDGGTLKQYCSICGEELGGLAYRKGFDQIAEQTSKTAELEGGGAYYATTTIYESFTGVVYNPSAFIGFKVTEPGTYTLSFEDVFVPSGTVRYLYGLWIDKDNYATSASSSKALITNAKWSTVSSMKTKAAKFDIQIDGFTDGSHEQLKSITFVITQENVDEFGPICIKVGIDHELDGSPITDRQLGFIIKLDSQTASTAVAVQETALLPSKRED